VSHDELAALADGELAPARRTMVRAAVAASPELAELLATQLRVAAAIRSASARVRAPDHLREAIPPGGQPRSTGMDAHQSLPVPLPAPPWSMVARALGALAVLAVGAVHLQQYLWLYHGVPTIGTLFVLNFAGATVIGLALLAPVERIAGRRGPLLVALLSLAGIALAATSFVFLLVSEHTPLFGFMEPGYDPTAIATARAAEIATVVLLGAHLLATRTRPRRSP
jgi:hypothetical protein